MNKPESSKDTFCIEPWRQVHFDSYGRPGPCCNYLGRDSSPKMNIEEYLGSEELQNIKQQILRGQSLSGCESCYKHERQNKQSMRQRRNKKYGIEYNSMSPQHLMVTFGNLCNAGCRMCNPSRSSVIAKNFQTILEKQAGADEVLFRVPPSAVGDVWRGTDKIEKIISKMESFTSVEITGGEPFLYPEFEYFLEEVSRRFDPSKISLSITTNTTNLEKYVDRLSLFKNIQLSLSIDSIGKNFELIRWPLKWGKVEKNLDLLSSLPDKFSWTFVCVPMNLNLHRLPEVIKYFLDRGCKTQSRFMFSHLNSKLFLAPYLAPEELKTKILGDLEKVLDGALDDREKQALRGLMSEIRVPLDESESYRMIEKLQNYTKALDTTRQQVTWDSLGWNPGDIHGGSMKEASFL